MPEYVIEREVPEAGTLTDDQLKDLSLQSLNVIQGLGHSVQWLHSYVCDNKVYCVYLSPDESLIREHASRLGLPADRIARVRRLLDPARPADTLVQPPRD